MRPGGGHARGTRRDTCSFAAADLAIRQQPLLSREVDEFRDANRPVTSNTVSMPSHSSSWPKV